MLITRAKALHDFGFAHGGRSVKVLMGFSP